jgi:hypothetical protein
VHLLGSAFEEASTAADEHGVASEDSAIATVLEEEADGVLSVAGCVEGCDLDRANVECLLVTRRLGYFGAIPTTNHGQAKCFDLVVELVLRLI